MGRKESETEKTSVRKWLEWGFGGLGAAVAGVLLTWFIASYSHEKPPEPSAAGGTTGSVPPDGGPKGTVPVLAKRGDLTTQEVRGKMEVALLANDLETVPVLAKRGDLTTQEVRGKMEVALLANDLELAWDWCSAMPNPDTADEERLRIWMKMLNNNRSDLASPDRLKEFETEYARKIAGERL